MVRFRGGDKHLNNTTMVPQHIIDEAKARGIVPGAVIKTPTGNDYTQVVAPFEKWDCPHEGTVWNGPFIGDSICIYDADAKKWATVITPAPQAAPEGLVEMLACDCDATMRRVIVDKAKEKGLDVRGVEPEERHLLGIRTDRGVVVVTNASRDMKEYVFIPPGEFYDRLCRTTKPEPPIRIDGHEVKFMTNGDIKVGCTPVDFSTLEAVYNKAKQTKQ